MNPSPHENAAPSSRKQLIAAALLITLLGGFLRFYHLSTQSFWTDEINSLNVARAPLDQIYEKSASVNNSLPTYFLLLRVLIGARATNIEGLARSPSALAGTLSILVLIAVVYFWRGHLPTALCAGLLLAVNPLHLWYSQEARAYALMLLFGLLTFLFFEIARTRRRPIWWVLYSAAALAALSLHKTALIFPALCGLWHLLEVFRTRPGILLVHLPAALAGLIVLSLKSYRSDEGYLRAPSILELPYTFMTFLGGYSFGPSPEAIQSNGPWAAVAQWKFQVGILLLVFFVLLLAYARNFRRFVLGKETGLLVVNVLIVAVYSIISRFPYNVRYTLPGFCGFIVVIASFNSLPRKYFLAPLSITCVLLLSLWADTQWYFVPAYRKADSRGVAQWLVTHRQTVKSWTVLPGYLSECIQWYLRPNPNVWSGYLPPKSDQDTSFPPVPDALIFGRRHHITHPERVLADYKSAAGPLQELRDFAGFELYLSEAAIHQGQRP